MPYTLCNSSKSDIRTACSCTQTNSFIPFSEASTLRKRVFFILKADNSLKIPLVMLKTPTHTAIMAGGAINIASSNIKTVVYTVTTTVAALNITCYIANIASNTSTDADNTISKAAQNCKTGTDNPKAAIHTEKPEGPYKTLLT